MSTAGADYGGPDLSHLHSSAQESALLGLEERLPHLRADRWIGYTRATTALQRLETLLDWPRKQRMPNLLIIGPTNNGKSMLIEKFRRDHPEKAKDGYITRPVVVMRPRPRPRSRASTPTSSLLSGWTCGLGPRLPNSSS